ncbi:unnamed protein product, partial [Ectocarpus sp. 8 AP-2014]
MHTGRQAPPSQQFSPHTNGLGENEQLARLSSSAFASFPPTKTPAVLGAERGMASNQGMRAQIEGHWRNLDSLAEMQSGGNEAIIRAIDVFEGARGAFIAVQEARGGEAGAAA